MDLPVHIATGALVGNAVLYIETNNVPTRRSHYGNADCLDFCQS
jgi:hypothetical protein